MNFQTFILLYIIVGLAIVLIVLILCIFYWLHHWRVDALNQLGINLWLKGKVEKSIAILHKALYLNPRSASTHAIIALILLESKANICQSLREIDIAIKIEPLNARFYYIRSKIFLEKLNDPISGKRDLSKAAQLGPGLPQHYFSKNQSLKSIFEKCGIVH